MVECEFMLIRDIYLYDLLLYVYASREPTEHTSSLVRVARHIIASEHGVYAVRI